MFDKTILSGTRKRMRGTRMRRSPVRRVSVRRRELLKESGCSVESMGGVRRKWGFIG